MKLALLGPKDAGKTVKMTALHHRFHTEPGAVSISKTERARALDAGMSLLHSLRIRMLDSTDEGQLLKDAELLRSKPMRFPESTLNLNKVRMEVEFEFLSLGSGKVRSYDREVEFYDPAGGAIQGTHMESDSINREIASCDGGIVFLSAEHLLRVKDADNKDELADVRRRLATGKIAELLGKMRDHTRGGDIFPICFVVSQADRISSAEEVERVGEVLYDKLLLPLSRDYPWLMISVCPISVVDPETNLFKAVNVEWPFLFSAMGVIHRNALAMERLARSNESLAESAERRASQLRSTYDDGIVGKAKYFFNFWKTKIKDGSGESFVKENERAMSYRTESGRYMQIYEDDHALSQDIATRYTQQHDGALSLLMNGRIIEANERMLLESA